MVSTTPDHQHPLDQLTIQEIKDAAQLCRALKPEINFAFNSITLREPPKVQILKYYQDSSNVPDRCATAIAFEAGTTTLYEIVINLTAQKVESFVNRKGVMPTITLEDLQATEDIVRADPRVIKLCADIGIDDMSKVYCDAWTIGFDERWGTKHRLQQALMYYRVSEHDNQYAHPLDFCPIVDTQTEKVVEIDVKIKKGSKYERAQVPMAQHNYMPEFIQTYRDDVKPLNITQPEGVSFTMNGGEISWLGFKLHIGFNSREGIVLNNVRVEDPETGIERSMFHRLSISEMVVPYGCPEKPHHRKHAFDVGEYGMGLMTNSLQLGCDCKGSIHYLDGVISNRAGEATVIRNAVCIHEEDAGILFKHTDFRDENVISTRGRKLVISQVFTAANYEYAIYWVIYQDGTIQIELKLTGMLNTYVLAPDEPSNKWGTEVADRVIAHNHQHIFNIRIDPAVDGQNNTVIQSDAVPAEEEVGSEENFYGNGFYAKKTVYKTTKDGAANYCHETSRTWDICNTEKLHPFAKKPVAYKIVSRESPMLMAKPGSLVWKRAAFARNTIHVTPYVDGDLYPAGNYVPQTNGVTTEGNHGIAEWIAEDKPIEQKDIVIWFNFGLTHFPRAEDFPIMPTEPVSMLLRPNNFFTRNPALHVRPSIATFGLDGKEYNARDKCSTLAI